MTTILIVLIILGALFVALYFYRRIRTADLPKRKTEKQLLDTITADDLAKCRKYVIGHSATLDELLKYAKRNCPSYPAMVGSMFEIYRSIRKKDS